MEKEKKGKEELDRNRRKRRVSHSFGATKVGFQTASGKGRALDAGPGLLATGHISHTTERQTSAYESAPFFRPCLPHLLSYCSGIIIESLPDGGFMGLGRA